MADEHPNLVEVYRAASLPEAHGLRLVLEEEGIRVEIEGELLQGAVGDLPMGWPTAPRLMAPEEQAAAARAIIEREAAAERDKANEPPGPSDGAKCLACGEAMAESDRQCAACGWSYLEAQEPPSDSAPPATTPEPSAAAEGSRVRRFAFVIPLVVVGGLLIAVWWSRYEESTESQLNRANQELKRRDYDSAVARCSAILKNDPTNLSALAIRGAGFMGQGRFQQAAGDYRTIIKLAHDNAADWAYVYLAEIYQAMGEYKLALAQLRRATQLYSQSYEALTALAWLRATCPEAEIRDGKKAVEHARAACVLTEWKDPACLAILAAAYAEAGEFAEAADWQRKVLTWPDYLDQLPDREQEIARHRTWLALYEAGKPNRQSAKVR